MSFESPTPPYIGRFAPSPSGPLHFGSLVCAVASYLHARVHKGQWLVRMEDLDPPREQPGADKLILEALEAHGLIWDKSVLYQSTRLEAYQAGLEALDQQGLIYRCKCTRKRLATLNGVYDRHCLNHPPTAITTCAWRVKIDPPSQNKPFLVEDLIYPAEQIDLQSQVGDFIVKRKDGLFAYHLAVVVDDIHQSISHIIRGDDLRDSTPPHLYLYQCFDAAKATYGHIPVVKDQDGNKLSKQHGAKAIENQKANDNLWCALGYLGVYLDKNLKGANPAQLLEAAVNHIGTNQAFLKVHFSPTIYTASR